MDGRQVPLDSHEQPKRTIKRKNSIEEKVKLLDSKEKKALEEGVFESLDAPVRKSSKDNKLSSRFFVRSASSEKNDTPIPDSINYNKF